ncbi:MAG: N-acetylmuramoyl-L-alanine amidase [Acidobacteria bacterium]|nr:N-acetylmuramoyl-L-alanine amidase [Acidobacteriota bacterium]
MTRVGPTVLAVFLGLASFEPAPPDGVVSAQQPAARPPLSILTREGRRSLTVAARDPRELLFLDELADAFQLTVREDTLAGGITVSYKNRTIILTPDQALASVSGRLVSLSSAPARDGRRWLVPLDFISRALSLVYDARLDLRPASRLIIVGDLRVPAIGIRGEQAGPVARVAFEISPRVPQTITQAPGQILVHFDADALDVSIPTFAAAGLVSGIRTADQTTLAIELGPRFRQYRSSMGGDGSTLRTTIEILGDETTEPVGQPTPLPDAPPEALFPSLSTALRTAVIDPGHGGSEDGARGQAGSLEKEITLNVARRLKAALESQLGIRVILTRDGDETVPLDHRAAIANNNKADLFISLHANASLQRIARGAEVFYLSVDGYGDEARRTAESAGHILPTFGGGTRDIQVILWEMAQTRYIEASAALATIMEEELRTRVELSPRPVQQAPFRVLVGANMPAVLVEMGFVSNAEEEQRLTSGVHQSLIVQALLNGVVRFRSYLEQRRTTSPGGASPPKKPTGASRP